MFSFLIAFLTKDGSREAMYVATNEACSRYPMHVKILLPVMKHEKSEIYICKEKYVSVIRAL